MRRKALLIVVALAGPVILSGPPATAQTPPDLPGPRVVSVRSISVAGLPGGNANVALDIYYPATASSAAAPLDISGAPYDAVTFGHGFSLPASLYETLYRHFASHGFVVAVPRTEEGLFTGNLPEFIEDQSAAVAGLRDLAATSGHPLQGAVASGVRATAIGHSFGGAAALVAASGRPDLFDAVVTLAATATSPQNVDILGAAAALAVPILHMGSDTDLIVPPPQNLDPLWQASPPPRLLAEIGGGRHSYFHEAWYVDRLTEPAGAISVAAQQAIIRRYVTSFLDAFGRGGTALLPWLLGPAATGDPALSRFDAILDPPILFGAGSAAVGTTYLLTAARRAGDTALFAAALGAAAIPTPAGLLLLDPASLILLGTLPSGTGPAATLALPVPAAPGVAVLFQALLQGAVPDELTGAVAVTIVP